MHKKLHNPKSHAPAVYIPCWLIQVDVKLLSHGAKLVYGRLSQWCNETGHVYRSAPDLSEELGMCLSSVEKYLKELRDVGLIGTYHPQAGGVNHFEFYHHPWMDDPIKEQLAYKKDKSNPPYEHEVPPVQSYGTPPYNHADINKKEIKRNKIHNTPLPPQGDCVRFEEFWLLYPKKTSKKMCQSKWLRQNLDSMADIIISNLCKQVTDDDSWARGYAPNPLTYLNQERWNDEIQKRKQSGSSNQKWTMQSVMEA